MNSPYRTPPDPLEQDIERALRPGRFIWDRACFSFVRGLGKVAGDLRDLMKTEPERVAVLCETFLAGCQEKMKEVDDSSGNLGQFAQDLICLWIEARQTSGANPRHTASQLTSWMDDDPFAFCSDIENAVVAVFHADGLAAFAERIQARLECAHRSESLTEQESRYEQRRGGRILRAIFQAQGNIAAYIALTESTALTPEDCLAIAKMHGNDSAEALRWVERGRVLDGQSPFRSTAGSELDEFHGQLLTARGRGEEALAAVWAAYEAQPSSYRYDRLMQYADDISRPKWHTRAMDAAHKAHLRSRLDLFVHTNELDRLADMVREASDESLERESHYTTGPAAKLLQQSHPGEAARLWRAQGMRILGKKKSELYGAAVSDFKRARDCYRAAGLERDWEELVRLLRGAHRRKTAFMSRFDVVAADREPERTPSFLEQAKARWGSRPGGEE